MSPSDPDLEQQLRGYASYLDAESSTLDRPLPLVTDSGRAPRMRRVPILAAAAVLVLVAAGAVVLANRADNGAVTAAAPTEAAPESSEAALPTTAAPVPTTTALPAPTTTAVPENEPFENQLPVPAAATEVGPAEGRWLPPSDAGLRVINATQLLFSELPANALGPIPSSVQTSAMVAISPDDRRAVVATVEAFADEESARTALAYAEHHGLTPGTAHSIDGRPAVFLVNEGFAPFTGGEPMHDIGVLLMLDANRLVTLTGPDVGESELIAMAAGLVWGADGVAEYPVIPAGFEQGPVRVTQRSILAGGGDGHEDVLSVLLADDAGEVIELWAPAGDSADFPADGLGVVHGQRGHGYVTRGLFAEVVLTYVIDDMVITLRHYAQAYDGDALIQLADSLAAVDENQWVERTQGATLTRTPVEAITPE